MRLSYEKISFPSKAWGTPCILAKCSICANHCDFNKTHIHLLERVYRTLNDAGGICNLISPHQSNQPPALIRNGHRSLITARTFCTVNHERGVENVQALHGNSSAGRGSNRCCRYRWCVVKRLNQIKRCICLMTTNLHAILKSKVKSWSHFFPTSEPQWQKYDTK